MMLAAAGPGARGRHRWTNRPVTVAERMFEDLGALPIDPGKVPHPRAGRFTAYPRELHITVTDRCNLKCFICSREEHEERIGGPGVFVPIERLHGLESAIRNSAVINLTGFGETFIHPKFDEIVDFICRTNPRPRVLKFITNGTALTAKRGRKLRGRLANLVVSLNAANREDYEREMKSSWDLIMRRLGEFIAELDEEDRQRIELHYVTHAHNYARMSDFVRLCQELGVYQVNFNQYQVQRARNIEYSLMFVREEYNTALDRARLLGKKLGIRVVGRKFFHEKIPESDVDSLCVWPFEQVRVETHGEVQACCFSGGEWMGDVKRQSFEEIWFGDGYEALRKRRHLDACRSCPQLITYDDHRTHFHRVLKKQPEWAEVESRLLASEDRIRNRRELLTTRHLDPDLYNFAAAELGGDLRTRIEAFADQGGIGTPEGITGAIRDLDAAFRSRFHECEIARPGHQAIDLGDSFIGVGWSAPTVNERSGTVGRMVAPSSSGTIFLGVSDASTFMVRAEIDDSTPVESLAAMRVEINGTQVENSFDEDNGHIQFWCLIPGAIAANAAGRLAISFTDAASLGQGQGSRLGITRLRCDPVTIVGNGRDALKVKFVDPTRQAAMSGRQEPEEG
jgi:MoaA/NifB/PqqE/SkfB family radical SAM enzyme